MSGDDQQVLTVTGSAPDAAILFARLRDAGIPCTMRRPISVPGNRGTNPRHSVFVRADDLERARVVLQEEDGGFDEDELARLSEEAGRKAIERAEGNEPDGERAEPPGEG
jgi:hypothetical protein